MNYSETVQNVNKVLDQYHDTLLTLRQIYYRLVADYGLANKRSSYNQLSKILVRARENGEVDDTRIEDRSRETIGGDYGFSDPEQFWEWKAKDFTKNNYNRRLWDDQPQYVEVWVEKDALSRVIANAIQGFRVVTAPSRGYSSYTYLKRMAIDERFENYADRPIVILDFRDHDPSGVQMTEDLASRLKRYGSGLDIELKRIALTIDQVRHYGLANNPAKGADPRFASYLANYGSNCWELDAIPPDELQRLVKDAVEREVDIETWNRTTEEAEAQRKNVQSRLDELSEVLRTQLSEQP